MDHIVNEETYKWKKNRINFFYSSNKFDDRSKNFSNEEFSNNFKTIFIILKKKKKIIFCRMKDFIFTIK